MRHLAPGMEHYDQIVVGSGASGLTTALLLGLKGNRVLVLEKAPNPGGSLARFRRENIPFDVGLHFTGGLSQNDYGMLADMLAVLGLQESINPVFLPEQNCHRMVFPSTDETYTLPSGIERSRENLKRFFPDEKAGLDDYFELFIKVCERTTSMNVRGLSQRPPTLDEDYITLQDVLDEHIENPVLQAILAAFCTCHGTPPAEMAFSDHCRVTAGLLESSARIEGGGDAIVEAFLKALDGVNVEVRCDCALESVDGIKDRKVEHFILSDGSELSADACVFTIHPLKILKMLPDHHTTPAFRHRVRDFEPSVGFFSVFGKLAEEPPDEPNDTPIFSIYPDTDFNRMLSPECEGARPMVMMFGREKVDGQMVKTMMALEVSFFEDVEPWKETRTGQRGEKYAAYKRSRAEAICRRLEPYFPEFRNELELMATASMLTYRDYLNSPFGAAYGIKQKVGQFNLLGKLPLLNLYAAGQSSLLPGVVGAMASAFFVCRSVIGKPRFQKFIEGRLPR
ncbi:MAG: phytoene desaturase family protein [Candidatus Brocadiia bacterium]